VVDWGSGEVGKRSGRVLGRLCRGQVGWWSGEVVFRCGVVVRWCSGQLFLWPCGVVVRWGNDYMG
jgi:hypothetical protein